MRCTTFLLMLLLTAAGSSRGEGTAVVRIDPAASVIVLPARAGRQESAAAQELQKHLELVTGRTIAIEPAGGPARGRYPFRVGLVPPDDPQPPAPGEARWAVAADAAHCYGDAPAAVYGFLEEHLGIHWIEPGDAGIVCPPLRDSLALAIGTSRWAPRLAYRSLRSLFPRDKPKAAAPACAGLALTAEERSRRAGEVSQWLARMRMGGDGIGGGHACADWWPRYGREHPEYFALTKHGKREPVMDYGKWSLPYVKICESNLDVADQLVYNWLSAGRRSRFLSVGPNDGTKNFCRCPACRALDPIGDDEAFEQHLADRYAHLANQVSRRARAHDPEARATVYAYMATLQPPVRQKLEPNVAVVVIPYVDPLDTEHTAALFKGWREAGAQTFGFRPNYHYKYLTATLPMGLEKQLFEVFQAAVANGTVSADYDGDTMHAWPVCGLADYALARAMADPAEPFDHWEDEYASAFGAGAGGVRQYFRYWRRELWDRRLRPNMEAILKRGGAADFARGLMWSLDRYYRPEDFDRTDALLAEAAEQELSAAERLRLDQLILANRHARLVYNAAVPEGPDKIDAAKALLAFRRTHRDSLPFDWATVIANEIGWGDVTGMNLIEEMKDYLAPCLLTPLVWRFKLDPENGGLGKGWAARSWEETQDWEPIRTDAFWDHQEGLSQPLGAYDGIGWYATRVEVPPEWKGRAIFLRFGAVDESCWVTVNGRPAGTHLYQQADDWKTPFEIRIDPVIDWTKPFQQVTVRVEDASGYGGIWKRVWLVSKARSE